MLLVDSDERGQRAAILVLVSPGRVKAQPTLTAVHDSVVQRRPVGESDGEIAFHTKITLRRCLIAA